LTRIVGIHAVQRALEMGTGKRLRVRDGQPNQRQASLIALAEKMGCPIDRGSIEEGDSADQGVALEVLPPVIQSENALKALIARGDKDLLILILDGVTDPRNFGACLRSAASFGVSAVVVPKDNCAPLNEAAIKTASGAANLVPIYRVVNLGRCLDHLKKSGIWVVGTALQDAQSLTSIDLKGNIALLMGAEDKGLRQKTRERCDFVAEIPMPFNELSLNVSVAAGICLYEAQRQRM
jgi:23S rRNA (guanosine2251-2'-O)-methyltransferase